LRGAGAAAVTTRVVNVRTGESYDIYIGRANGRYRLAASKWQNPLKIGVHGSREQVLAMYEDYLCQHRPDLLAALGELKGKTLACWCAPPGGLTADDPPICHGQVLARLADQLKPEQTP
jgi:hypothetical protein